MNRLELPYIIANLCNERHCISPLVLFPFIPCIKWVQITHAPIKHNNS